MQMGEYLSLWLSTFVIPFRAANTAACYRRAIHALPPDLCSAELTAVNSLQLQAAINAQAVAHPRAAQLTFAMLHCALGKAVEIGMLPRSPMIGCIKPLHTPKRASVLTLPQLASYVQAARSQPAYPLLLLMATCGLRRSEALGLMWQDVQANTLHVQRQRIRINKAYQPAPLKSRAANRILPLDPLIQKELAQIQLRPFAGWICDVTPDALRKQHLHVLAAAQLPPITLHGLRHSMATAAAADGCPIKVLQGILGHARYQLTADLYADHLHYENYAPSMANLATKVIGL